jgi:HAE1 family hydrophobic/amphiphilic exporter-1
VRDTAITGGVLAIIILFLFLRDIKSTLIVAVSIPISVL